MIGSCNSIDLQVNRKGGRLVIGWANDRVYTVIVSPTINLESLIEHHSTSVPYPACSFSL